MSYSNHTQNYNLGLFADGDTIQYQDWNENAEKIDIALKSNATGVSGLQEFQAEITETVETVSIEQSALNTKVGALETKVNTNTSDIAKVQSAEAENSIDIENLQEKVQMNTDDINALEGGTNYQQLVQKTNTLETKVNANTVDIKSMSGRHDFFAGVDAIQVELFTEGVPINTISFTKSNLEIGLNVLNLEMEFTNLSDATAECDYITVQGSGSDYFWFKPIWISTYKAVHALLIFPLVIAGQVTVRMHFTKNISSSSIDGANKNVYNYVIQSDSGILE